MGLQDCDCDEPVAAVRDTVARVLINTHLKDTLPDIDLPPKINPLFVKILPPTKNRNIGIYTETRALLNPPPQSRFDQFNTAVRESVYKSQRDEQLGLPRRAWSKPPDVTNISRIFGDASVGEARLYDIILPPDVPKAVQQDWRTADIAKRRKYCYNEHYNKRHTFGRYYHPKIDGFCTNRCLHWIYHPANVCVIKDVQCQVRNRTWAPDGEVLEPQKNRLCVPPDFAYGLPSCGGETVANQLQECEPCQIKKDILKGVARLNALRLQLKRREGGVNFENILRTFRSVDKENVGFVPKEAAFLLMRKLRINADFDEMLALMRFMCILTHNDLIDYTQLINIFDIAQPYPMLSKIADVPNEHLHYSTTYGDLLADNLKPFTPNERRRQEQNECDRTHMINPGICEQNGLFHKDYMKGRTQEAMLDLFTESGYCFTEDGFNEAWTKCVAIDAHLNGLVSVETFRNYVDGQIEIK